jgi:hypothetical protein
MQLRQHHLGNDCGTILVAKSDMSAESLRQSAIDPVDLVDQRDNAFCA